MRRSIKKLLRCVLVLLILAVVGFALFRQKYHTAIRGLAETQVRNTTSDLINDAIDKQIECRNNQYDRIV